MIKDTLTNASFRPTLINKQNHKLKVKYKITSLCTHHFFTDLSVKSSQ
ncbi:hypothetical protein PTRA_a0347 [Pseudoalteromonas translucida KMM 520]|uniref:Uncharacterized protein n=1 Tax=Pseudoalteromonas translucida KMM 520 TaxID=1315283 RepID=A0A0U2MM97_9GAMM|nr:hypothetical protein PTRA_a0347 [Pseudoalteromonas translucida KMM 520]